MNAHHQKRSYRHSLLSPAEYLTMGSTLPGGAQLEKESQSAGAKGKHKANPVWKGIERVPFGYQVDLVIPSTATSTSSLPTELQQFIKTEATFQLAIRVNLAQLLVPAFLNDYIRNGSLVALSIDQSSSGDVVAIDGRGRLILHLTKDTYEVLGLPGRPSKFGALRHQFVVEIDLREEAFRVGKKGFERIKKLLSQWPPAADLFDPLAGVTGRTAEEEGKGRAWDMLFAFVDENGHPQPITFPSSVKCTTHAPTLSYHHLVSVPLPLSPLLPTRPAAPVNKRARTSLAFDAASAQAADDVNEWHDRLQATRDWVGLARIGADVKLREGKEGQVAGLKGEVSVVRLEGFWHPAVVRRVVQCALDGLHAASGPPFMAVSVSVPPHAPISHLATNPVPATRRRPGSDSRGDAKRGRGTGEEDERDMTTPETEGGWQLVAEKDGPWAFWETQ